MLSHCLQYNQMAGPAVGLNSSSSSSSFLQRRENVRVYCAGLTTQTGTAEAKTSAIGTTNSLLVSAIQQYAHISAHSAVRFSDSGL